MIWEQGGVIFVLLAIVFVIAWIIAWVILPFVVIAKLSSINDKVERIRLHIEGQEPSLSQVTGIKMRD